MKPVQMNPALKVDATALNPDAPANTLKIEPEIEAQRPIVAPLVDASMFLIWNAIGTIWNPDPYTPAPYHADIAP